MAKRLPAKTKPASSRPLTVKTKTARPQAARDTNGKNSHSFPLAQVLSRIKTTQLLYTLLLIATFLLGYLVARVQYLENGSTTTQAQGTTPGAITNDTIKAWAKEARLNTGKFTSCFDSGKFKAKIDKDANDGKQAGVSGTPSFFVNGHSVVGALPYSIFQNVIDFELKGGDWNNPDDTVKTLVDANPNNGEIGKEKQNVSLGELPALGNKNAKVTIVEFSDLQCPFCARFFKDTFPSIKKGYVDSGKVVMYFRHFPLEFHPMAVPFAIASECANEQGKFWKMHDLIFQKQSTT